MSQHDTDDEEEWLSQAREYIDLQVSSGYVSTADHANVIQIAQEHVEFALSEAQISKILDQAVKRFEQEQASWPDTTDNDRLGLAFRDLEANGILCRENYTCCNTCAHSEILHEMKTQIDPDRTVRGYVLFHQQDTERAVEGGGLWLSYGAFKGDPLEIAREVIAQLGKVGLSCQWDEDPGKKIYLPMTWQRRTQTA